MEPKTAKVFLGGLPTEPDVKLLMEKFGDLAPDAVVSHEQFEAALQLKRAGSRYRDILKAWRKRMLRERNVDFVAIRGIGLKRLLEPDRVREGVKDHSLGVKKIGRAIQRVGRVEREKLSESERAMTDHARRLMESVYGAAREASKEIAVTLRPVKSLPLAR